MPRAFVRGWGWTVLQAFCFCLLRVRLRIRGPLSLGQCKKTVQGGGGSRNEVTKKRNQYLLMGCVNYIYIIAFLKTSYSFLLDSDSYEEHRASRNRHFRIIIYRERGEKETLKIGKRAGTFNSIKTLGLIQPFASSSPLSLLNRIPPSSVQPLYT